MHLYGRTYSATVGARWAILCAVTTLFVLFCAFILHKLLNRLSAAHEQAVRQRYTHEQYSYLVDREERFYTSYGLPGNFEKRMLWLRESIAETPYEDRAKRWSCHPGVAYENASVIENGQFDLEISWPIGRPLRRMFPTGHKRSPAQDFGSWRKQREQYDKKHLPLPPQRAQPGVMRGLQPKTRASRRSAAFRTSTRLKTVHEEEEQPRVPDIASPGHEQESAEPFLLTLIDLPTVYHSLQSKKRRRHVRVAPTSPEDLLEVARMPARRPTMIEKYPAPVPATPRSRTMRQFNTSSTKLSASTPTRPIPLICVDTPPQVSPKDSPSDSEGVPSRATSLKTIAAGEDAFRPHLKRALMPPPPAAYAPNGLRAKMQEDAAEWRRSNC
ncbi:hypothetical protein LTR86_005208 [Recurvomyces mirabilis]|nr:hypothetical protein LTR86_005208 [Recurvomyces mirabilis]